MVQTAVAKGFYLDGKVETSEEIVPFEEYKQTLIYRELNHPNGIDHMLTCAIFGLQSSSGMPPMVLSLYRGLQHGAFKREEVNRLELLTPHISRALAVMSKLRDAELRIAASHAALDRLNSGVILFGGDGLVKFANKTARHALENEDGLLLQHRMGGSSIGMLMAEDAGVHAKLARAIQNALNPDPLNTEHFACAVTIPRPTGRQPYVLNFSSLSAGSEFGSGPDAPRAIAFLADNAEPIRLDARLMRQTYGLTQAETRCAELIAEGLTLEEVADQLQIARTTAKTQLQSVYEKTRTNNRAKLMKLIMSLSSAAN